MPSSAEKDYQSKRVSALSAEILDEGKGTEATPSVTKRMWLATTDLVLATARRQVEPAPREIAFFKLKGSRLVDIDLPIPRLERSGWTFRRSPPSMQERAKSLERRIEHELANAELRGDIHHRMLLAFLRDMSDLLDRALTLGAEGSSTRDTPSSEARTGHASAREVARDPRSWFILVIAALVLLSRTENLIGRFLQALGGWISLR